MELNFYVTKMGFEGSAALGGTLAASYWFMMLIGRFCSTLISGKISTKTQMTAVASVAICLLLIAIFLPESVTATIGGHAVPMKVFFIAACGLCTSIMWGGIFNLSVEGLGKYTEAASGIFMMMVVGGGVMPLVQNFIADNVGYMVSYIIPLLSMAYMFYYALLGSKNVNTDISVE